MGVNVSLVDTPTWILRTAAINMNTVMCSSQNPYAHTQHPFQTPSNACFYFSTPVL